MTDKDPLSLLPTRSGRRYGWRPQLPDRRDMMLERPRTLFGDPPLPAACSLRDKMPPVYDQGDLSSCTANATAAALEYNLIRQGLTDFSPSRLFIYYNTRVIEGDPSSDAGAECRDAIKAVATLGACSEAEWPYNASLLAMQPPARCYASARPHLVSSYLAVGGAQCPSLDDVKYVLANGEPVVFGMSTYSSFEGDDVAKTGVMPMPAKGEAVVGGHCVLAVGYDDSRSAVCVRNSWGIAWGDGGHFWMPYAFIAGYDCSDFWVVRSVQG